MNEKHFQQKHGCFKGENTKITLNMFSESFKLDVNTFLFFIIKLCFKKD